MDHRDQRNAPRLASPIANAQPLSVIPDMSYETDSYDVSMRETPDMANDLDHRMNLTETSDDDQFDQDHSDTNSSMIEDVSLEEAMKGLKVSSLPTGLCYDERMRYHSEVSATTGENVHPEDPRRIYYIYKELCEAGLVDTGNKNDLVVSQPLLRIPAREVTREEVELVHVKPHHWDFVKSTSTMSDEDLIDLSEDPHMDSIYFNSLSFYSGKLSAGGAIETCKAVFEREKVKNAIAVIRPPGHHAETNQTMGFCLFNNCCIASRVCQNTFGEKCRKILILDWDVHHGNGCQKAFYEDPNILYISLHVHMDGKFYPSTQDGAMDKVGAGRGVGMNVNIPWPTKGMGDGDYMYAFQHVVMPIAMEFDPDLVIVAAGFDAAAGDELGGCFVNPPCYAHMTHMLMSLADGKVAVCLEGGYNFGAISKSALAVTRTLMGEPPDRLIATQPTKSAVDTVQKVRHIQSRYWHCLSPKDPTDEIFGGQRLHEIIRQSQAMHLYDVYRLTRLEVFRDNISKSFDNQILASSEYEDKRVLLVIFHDPPEVLVPGGRTSNVISPHQATVKDGATAYIEWCVLQRFGVIDVNIPEFITPYNEDLNDHDARVSYSTTESDSARIEGEKLANYLYTNYIEPNDHVKIILMGVGNAFHAIAKLLSENDSVYQNITGVVGFISTNPVRPVGNQANPWITSWYRDNSLIFVANTHGLWRRAKDGKISKRYGDIHATPGDSVNDIMHFNQDKVKQWILDKIQDDDATEDELEATVLKGGAAAARSGGATAAQSASAVKPDAGMHFGDLLNPS